MTGFGKATQVHENKKITVEVKSLNSKQLDLSVRLSMAYRGLELPLRNRVAQTLQRGKVELHVSCEHVDASASAGLNIELIKAYKAQLELVSKELGIAPPDDWYATLLRLPDVFKTDLAGDEPSEAESSAVMQTADQALAALVEFRAQEGRRLQEFFEEKIAMIRRIFGEVEQYEAGRVERIKARFIDGLTKFEGVDYDNNRLEQELFFYIEKLDITEEKTRLQNHINYFLETLHAAEAGQGKKLGFITQEMGREINTLGSKANQADLQQVVVRMKDHLEQIKEQVLNVM